MAHADAAFKRLSKKQKEELARQSLAKTLAKKEQNQRARVARKIKGDVRIERWVPRDQVEEVDDTPKEFIQPGERGFLSVNPKYGCNEVMSSNEAPLMSLIPGGQG